MVEDLGKPGFHHHFFLGGKIALEHGILKMDAESLTDLMDFAKAFGVADIVSNNEVAAHGSWWSGGVVGVGLQFIFVVRNKGVELFEEGVKLGFQ